MNSTAARNFFAEYLAARIDSYMAPEFSAEERKHQKRSEAILRAADRAGVDVYAKAISLDAEARATVFGAPTA